MAVEYQQADAGRTDPQRGDLGSAHDRKAEALDMVYEKTVKS
jgi:hypothetical protein